MACDFLIGDFVWAKMKGYPWWPAVISNPMPNISRPVAKKAMHFVRFFGQESYAWILDENLKSYKDHMKMYSACQSVSLQNALADLKDYEERRKIVEEYVAENEDEESSSDVTSDKEKETSDTDVQEVIPPAKRYRKTKKRRKSVSGSSSTAFVKSTRQKSPTPAVPSSLESSESSLQISVTKSSDVDTPSTSQSVTSDATSTYEQPVTRHWVAEQRTSASSSSSIEWTKNPPPSQESILCLLQYLEPYLETSPYDPPLPSLSNHEEFAKDKRMVDLWEKTGNNRSLHNATVVKVNETNDAPVTGEYSKVGFLGLEGVGLVFAMALHKAGFSVTVWNKTLLKLFQLKQSGLSVAVTPKDVVAASDIIFCYALSQIESTEMVFGPFGAVHTMSKGKIYVELSSIGPKASVDLNAAIKRLGGAYLEAPVISFYELPNNSNQSHCMMLVSGNKDVFKTCKSFLEVIISSNTKSNENLSDRIIYLDKTIGTASKLNLVFNMFVVSTSVALVEFLNLAIKTRASIRQLIDIIHTSPLNCPFFVSLCEAIAPDIEQEKIDEVDLSILLEKLRSPVPLQNGDAESNSSMEVDDDNESTTENSLKIGFLWLSPFGRVIATKLLESEVNLMIWHTSPLEYKPFYELGATMYETSKEVITSCDIIFSCVASLEGLQEIILDRQKYEMDALRERQQEEVAALLKTHSDERHELLPNQRNGVTLDDYQSKHVRALLNRHRNEIEVVDDYQNDEIKALQDQHVNEKLFKGKHYVHLTPLDPETSKALKEKITEEGGLYLEAPAIGGKEDAENNNVTIICAGSKVVYQRCLPYLNKIARKTVYLHSKGEAVGDATTISILYNMLYGSCVASLAEVLGMIKKLKIPQEKLMEIIERSPSNGPLYSQISEACINRFPLSTNYPLICVQKVLKMALNLSDKFSLSIPTAAAANEVFKQAIYNNYRYRFMDVSSVYMIYDEKSRNRSRDSSP